jgi:hypothetical protein
MLWNVLTRSEVKYISTFGGIKLTTSDGFCDPSTS